MDSVGNSLSSPNRSGPATAACWAGTRRPNRAVNPVRPRSGRPSLGSPRPATKPPGGPGFRSGEVGGTPLSHTDGQRRLPPAGVQPLRSRPRAPFGAGSSWPERGLLRAFRSNGSERPRRPKMDIGRGLSRACRHARGCLPRLPSPRASGTANRRRSLGAQPGHAAEERPPPIAFGHGEPRARFRLLGACQEAAFGAPAIHSPERGLGVSERNPPEGRQTDPGKRFQRVTKPTPPCLRAALLPAVLAAEHQAAGR